MSSCRLLLLIPVASLLAVAACGSFGSAPSPVDADSGVADAATSTPEASIDAGGVDSSVPPGPGCAAPLVTDPNVTAECPGSPGKVYLASDSRHCGRCGYSCGVESCVAGVCAERGEDSDVEVERMLGVSNGMAFVSTKNEIRAFSAGEPSKLFLAFTNETPIRAVMSQGTLYFRTPGALRSNQGADLPVAGNAPFLAPFGQGVVTSGNEVLQDFQPSNKVLKDLVAIPSPKYVEASGQDLVVYSASSQPSLRVVSGNNARELVGKIANVTALQVFQGQAYYALGNEVWRVPVTGGSPTLIATSPKPIKAYVEGPALAVDGDTVRFLATSDGTNFDLYEQDQCPGAKPRLVATPQNSKGVLVTNDRVYWVVASNQLHSRAIAKKN